MKTLVVAMSPVGVIPDDMRIEVEAIATDPHSEHILEAPFSELYTLIPWIEDFICKFSESGEGNFAL